MDGAGLDATVIVPARDAAGTIVRALDALAAQRFDGEFEVIVVDSGSADGTAALAAAHAVVTAVLENPGGEPAGSRNLAAARSQAPVLAFTDADCEPDPGWLAAGVAAVRSGADLVQGAVRPAGGGGPFDRSVWVSGPSGLWETASLFVARGLFERLGGFEPLGGHGVAEGRARPFGEDVWLGWRARRAGAAARFEPAASVRHEVQRRGLAAFLAEKARRARFPALVRAIPELRREALFARVFLSPRSAAFDLALVGATAALVAGSPPALALGLPYVAVLARDAAGWGRVAPRALVGFVTGDAVTFAALVAGSARHRTPVL